MAAIRITSIAKQTAWAFSALAAVGITQAGAELPQTLAVGGTSMQAAAPAANSSDQDEWRFDLRTYTWLVGMEGDVGARGRTADVDASFSDILDASDSLMAFSGRFEIGKGRWGGFVEGIYSKLGADDQTGPGGNASVDITFTMAVVDFGAMYRVAEWTPDGSAGRNRRPASIDIYAGGRYTNLDLEVDPANFDTQSASQSWIDPIVGAKFAMPLSESWYIHAYGDVGGFGVSSDLTWSATGYLGYDFEVFDWDATIFAGYRAVGMDYSDGSGSDEFTFDTILHGPVIGLNIKF